MAVDHVSETQELMRLIRSEYGIHKKTLRHSWNVLGTVLNKIMLVLNFYFARSDSR